MFATKPSLHKPSVGKPSSTDLVKDSSALALMVAVSCLVGPCLCSIDASRSLIGFKNFKKPLQFRFFSRFSTGSSIVPTAFPLVSFSSSCVIHLL